MIFDDFVSTPHTNNRQVSSSDKEIKDSFTEWEHKLQAQSVGAQEDEIASPLKTPDVHKTPGGSHGSSRRESLRRERLKRLSSAKALGKVDAQHSEDNSSDDSDSDASGSDNYFEVM
jgi:hypothetical protein